MVACPYGAITVMLTGEGVQALKCDLCRHRAEGPACIAACPTQALRCLEGAELERLSARGVGEWRWRCRRARGPDSGTNTP